MTKKGDAFLPNLNPLEHPNVTRGKYRKGVLYLNLSPRQVNVVDAMVDRMTAAERSVLPGSKLPRIPRSRALAYIIEEYGVIAGLIPPGRLPNPTQ